MLTKALKTIYNQPKLSVLATVLFFTTPLLALPQSAQPHRTEKLRKIAAADLPLPVGFEANRGQAHQDTKFFIRGRGYLLSLSQSGASLLLRKGNEETAVLRVKPLNANPRPDIVGLEKLPGETNYFMGADSTQWYTSVPQYRKVKYTDVYPGVDLVYYQSTEGLLEYDFILAAGVDPDVIRLNFEGITEMAIANTGDLVLRIEDKRIIETKPLIYQEINGTKRILPGHYIVHDNNEVGFHVESFDPERPLIIDPVLNFSTYFGGPGEDFGLNIAVNPTGIFICGSTESVSGISTQGAAKPDYAGGRDAFIAKFDTTGSNLIYATYLGGGGDDRAWAITVDPVGNAYVTGHTTSNNFPTTLGAFQTASQGDFEGFMTKLDASGSTLLYSTYFGGSKFDRGWAITTDPSGNVYLTGETDSNPFPLTPATAYQNTFGGSSRDAFVMKLDPAGFGDNDLLYSTYLGGNGAEEGQGIEVDPSGMVYAMGYTFSANFPTTTTGYQTTYEGDGDRYIVKLDVTAPPASQLLYGTYLGGTANDQGHGGTIDQLGNVYVTGNTASTDNPATPTNEGFPTTPNAIQPQHGGGTSDAYLAKLDPTAAGPASLVYGTYLGGNAFDAGINVALDHVGNAHIVGITESADFPLARETDNSLSGSRDAFVATIKLSDSTLLFSTYFGGDASEQEGLGGIAIDDQGSIYLTGDTTSNDFPRVNPLQDMLQGTRDAFLAKIKVRDPVILIPGIMGSELQGLSTGNTVWLDLLGLLTECDEFLFPLSLDADGRTPAPNISIPCDGLSGSGSEVTRGNLLALGVEPVTTTLPYGPLVDCLSGASQICPFPVETFDIVPFPYDWRLDWRTIAEQLREEVIAQAPNPTDKVDIIAHSMGGLIARTYMQLNPSDHRIDKIIYLSTPHLGSPKGFAALKGWAAYEDLFGKFFGMDIPFVEQFGILSPGLRLLNDSLEGINFSTLTTVGRNFSSVYELLPRYDFFQPSGSPVPEDFNLTYDRLDEPPGELGNAFLGSEAMSLWDATIGDVDDNPLPDTSYSINGSGQKTLLRLVQDPVLGCDGFRAVADLSGDGTVPAVSLRGLENVIDYYVKSSHLGVVSNKVVIETIAKILADQDSDVVPIPGTLDTQPFGSQGIAYFSCSPVRIRVFDSAGNMVGLDEEGNLRTEIEDGDFFVFQSNESGFLPTNDVFNFELDATDHGTFSLFFEFLDSSNPSSAISFQDIPISANSRAQLILDPDSPSQILELDVDGDGGVDFSLINDGVPPADSYIVVLIDVVKSFRLQEGIETDLISSLEAARASLGRDEKDAAANQLSAFRNKVRALEGNKITAEQAQVLLDLVAKVQF